MEFPRPLIPVLAAALTLSGCAALTDASATGDGSGERSRTVAAGLYPLQYVAARVAGDAYSVENLTSPGGEPHDLTLGLGETALVADADLLVHLESLQPDVDAAAENVAEGEVLDAGSVVDLLPFDEEEGHAHDEEEHAAEGEHDHGEYDPHFWLDSLRTATLGDAIAERLSDLDPERAEEFAAGAAALRADLTALDREYVEGLTGCAITTVVTTHDAFGYLGRYGLHLESIHGISPDAEPTPAALADLQDLIESDGITTVFSESLVSPENAETLARDAGVRTAVLDTVEGLSDETADEDYLSLMRRNLTALQEANRC